MIFVDNDEPGGKQAKQENQTKQKSFIHSLKSEIGAKKKLYH